MLSAAAEAARQQANPRVAARSWRPSSLEQVHEIVQFIGSGTAGFVIATVDAGRSPPTADSALGRSFGWYFLACARKYVRLAESGLFGARVKARDGVRIGTCRVSAHVQRTASR